MHHPITTTAGGPSPQEESPNPIEQGAAPGNIVASASRINPGVEPQTHDAILSASYIEEINRAFGFSTGWKLKTGQLLNRAKKELLHGEWMSMFEDRKLKFGLRTAEMLMQMGRHATLCNSKYFSSLPQTWSTLYLLSRLPPELVEQAILSGVIHPGMKLAEARRLLQIQQTGTPSDPGAVTPPPFDLARQQARLLCYLRQQGTRWPPVYRAELTALLEGVVAELRAQENKS